MTITDGENFTISRVFAAPRPLLFSCFTSAEHMQHWWGPKGFKLIQPKMDFRVGGIFHYGMQPKNGPAMWGRFVFREIAPPERLVFVNSFSDEEGGLARAPFFDGKWPLEMLSTFLFDEVDANRTRFTVKWTPLDATDEERATVAANQAGMTGGWTGTLDQLDAYLATLAT